MQPITHWIESLLIQAEQAHGQYEQTILNGIYDRDWASWYANYAIDQGIEKVLNSKHLKPAEFKRFWGVKLETFEQMVEIVSQHNQQKKKSGRPGKTSLEDQVLMTLEYWRVGSHLFPHRSILGSDGIYRLSNYSENRKNFKSVKSFYSTWKKVPSTVKHFYRCHRHWCNRKP